MWSWFGWTLVVMFAFLTVRWRTRAKKGLILTHLLVKGEQTGMQLRDAGVGSLVYNYLCELEKEGLIERRLDALPPASRGGIPRYFYRIKPHLLAAAKGLASVAREEKGPVN